MSVVHPDGYLLMLNLSPEILPIEDLGPRIEVVKLRYYKMFGDH